jgi:hypothetical protein
VAKSGGQIPEAHARLGNALHKFAGRLSFRHAFSIDCATPKNPDFKGVLRSRGPKRGKTYHARQDEFAPDDKRCLGRDWD